MRGVNLKYIHNSIKLWKSFRLSHIFAKYKYVRYVVVGIEKIELSRLRVVKRV